MSTGMPLRPRHRRLAVTETPQTDAQQTQVEKAKTPAKKKPKGESSASLIEIRQLILSRESEREELMARRQKLSLAGRIAELQACECRIDEIKREMATMGDQIAAEKAKRQAKRFEAKEAATRQAINESAQMLPDLERTRDRLVAKLKRERVSSEQQIEEVIHAGRLAYGLSHDLFMLSDGDNRYKRTWSLDPLLGDRARGMFRPYQSKVQLVKLWQPYLDAIQEAEKRGGKNGRE